MSPDGIFVLHKPDEVSGLIVAGCETFLLYEIETLVDRTASDISYLCSI